MGVVIHWKYKIQFSVDYGKVLRHNLKSSLFILNTMFLLSIVTTSNTHYR